MGGRVLTLPPPVTIPVDTKAKALDYGKDLAKQEGLGQIVVHKADGPIEEFTYGDDPRDIPG